MASQKFLAMMKYMKLTNISIKEGMRQTCLNTILNYKKIKRFFYRLNLGPGVLDDLKKNIQRDFLWKVTNNQ